MSFLPLQVHHSLRPAGTHARGRTRGTGGTGSQHQEPAGLCHRDEGRDSPLSQPPPPPPRAWPVTPKPPPGPTELVFVSRGPTARAEGKRRPIVNVHSVVSPKKKKFCVSTFYVDVPERDRRERHRLLLLREDAWRVPRHQRLPLPPPRHRALPLYGTPVAPSAAESDAQGNGQPKERASSLLGEMWTVRGGVCVHMLLAVPDHLRKGWGRPHRPSPQGNSTPCLPS